jgi:UDP-3-O-[3-hydroxymyristoyl] glucosamine N-acyltransferase
MERRGYVVASIVHPVAYVSPRSLLHRGCIILAGSVVQTAAVIGCGTIVNNNATVEHDCILDGFVHMASGAALGGNVKIGIRTLSGSGACVRKRVHRCRRGARCRIRGRG